MPEQVTSDNIDDLGILLSQTHPQLNPLEVDFGDLQRYILALPEFKGVAQDLDSTKLQAIQMAWHEEFLDRTQG